MLAALIFLPLLVGLTPFVLRLLLAADLFTAFAAPESGVALALLQFSIMTYFFSKIEKAVEDIVANCIYKD